jgi:Rieske 2Fe-2S family protein
LRDKQRKSPNGRPQECIVTLTSPTSSLIPTLPGSTYTDEAIFAAEQARIFEMMWFCAARSSDLPGPGSFTTVQVGRESVLITRNRKGEVRAFFNVCRHRGAQLCNDESGQAARAFQCPYHAWTYDFDGKLIAAPNLTKMPDIDRIEYGLRKISVHEWLGYVWVCLAEEPPSFDDSVRSAIVDRLGDLESIERYGVESLAVGRRIRYDVRANWKLIIENFMECYHCATIHPELTEVLPEFADGYAAQFFVGHGAEFGTQIKGFTVDGSEGLDRIPGVSEDQDRRYYAITVRPQVFINLVPDHVILHRMFPVAADHTIVECDWLYLPGVVESGKDVSTSVELFDRVNRQDFDACERCQPAMSSRVYASGGVLVPSEHHIAEFHEWVQGMLSSAPHPTAHRADVAHPATVVRV